MYSIGEFSKITGLTVKTLRFYHEQGLLTRPRSTTRTAIATSARGRSSAPVPSPFCEALNFRCLKLPSC